jgi:carboxypeptidase Taq
MNYHKSMDNTYKEFVEKMQKIADVTAASNVMNWDQETYMPPSGAEFRARQIGTLSGIEQEMKTDSELEKLAREVLKISKIDSNEHVNARIYLRDLEKNKKLSPEFIAEFAKAKSSAALVWQKAKAENDFATFLPHLEKIVTMTREMAALLDPKGDPYEALVDLYEPEMSLEKLDAVFAELKKGLVPMIKKINDAQKINDSVLFVKYDEAVQKDVAKKIVSDLGFDFDRGRSDLVEHPFCTTFSPNDVRITTRIKSDDFTFGLWSSIHESGHAMYEQGMPSDQYGLPLGDSVGMGVHESQSRLWENNVCRSEEFTIAYLPYLKEKFPDQLEDVTVEQFYKAINTVKPWPIRIEADELTYHLHIIIRYEIERDLVQGKIEAADTAELWRSKYKEYLGIDITSDSEGVLQDVHWSCGYIGYFPTYSLGSLYAAQYYAAAMRAMPSLKQKSTQGDFKELQSWLGENIHQHGRRYNSEDLCNRVTGEGLNPSVFIEYAREKFGKVYNITL